MDEIFEEMHGECNGVGFRHIVTDGPISWEGIKRAYHLFMKKNGEYIFLHDFNPVFYRYEDIFDSEFMVDLQEGRKNKRIAILRVTKKEMRRLKSDWTETLHNNAIFLQHI